MTLTRLNEIPGLKVGDRVVCTSATGHDDGRPCLGLTVGKTYTVAWVDELYWPLVLDDLGGLSGRISGYFTPAPRETAEDAERPVTLTEGWGPWRTDISEWNVTTHDVRFECIGGIHKISLRPRAAAEAHLRGEPEGKTLAQCCMCGQTDMSTAEDGGPECELSDGRWVCSSECWDLASAITGLVSRATLTLARTLPDLMLQAHDLKGM